MIESPTELEPIYTTAEPNQTIMLASEEDIEILCDGTKWEGKADVCLRFLPKPRLHIESVFQGLPPSLNNLMNLDSYTIYFPSWSCEIKCLATQKSSSSNKSKPLRMTLTPTGGPLTIGDASNGGLQKVIFHLLNFYNFLCTDGNSCSDRLMTNTSDGSSHRLGCAVLVAGGWRITLSALLSTKENTKALKNTGGYAITHVGEIRRDDRELFSVAEAEELLCALHYFFSFARGFWAAPLLPVGFDECDVQVWKEWGVRFVDSWRDSQSWFDEHHGQLLREVFPGFWELWQKYLWQTPLRGSVYRYLRSNTGSRGTDGGIVLTQAALELLAFNYVVNDKVLLTNKGFNDIWASDKFRLLFSSLSLPLEIPNSLHEMTNLKKQFGWLDAPHGLTEIRNQIVHPDHRSRGQFNKVLYDAWNLGLWYVEMVLLRLCNHNGKYGCRLTQRWVGQVGTVSWAI